jgi:hypothetical protein
MKIGAQSCSNEVVIMPQRGVAVLFCSACTTAMRVCTLLLCVQKKERCGTLHPCHCVFDILMGHYCFWHVSTALGCAAARREWQGAVQSTAIGLLGCQIIAW